MPKLMIIECDKEDYKDLLHCVGYRFMENFSWTSSSKLREDDQELKTIQLNHPSWIEKLKRKKVISYEGDFEENRKVNVYYIRAENKGCQN